MAFTWTCYPSHKQNEICCSVILQDDVNDYKIITVNCIWGNNPPVYPDYVNHYVWSLK